MNTAEALTNHVFTRIQELESLSEITAGDSPYHILRHPESENQVGSIRVFKGSKIIDSAVIVNLRVEDTQMDAYMVMAFTRPGSLYPHLAFDCEILPNHSGFHIDLIHKKEFTTDIDYVLSVMEPLSEAFDAANANPDYKFSEATHLMKALLNPWMASYHCPPEKLETAQVPVDAYLDHWLSLENRPPDEIQVNTVDDEKVSKYDKAHRKAMFDPKVDVLWDFITKTIGQESRDLILRLCHGEESLD